MITILLYLDREYKTAMKKETLSALAISMAVSAQLLLDNLGDVAGAKRKRALRPCLKCGKKHDHNNSFCSAECCKAWKNERIKQP